MKKNTKKNLFNIAIAGAVVTGSVVALAPVEAEAATNFTDLNPSNIHYDDIMNLVERGMIKGLPGNVFKAEDSITRQDAAVIIARVLDLDTENVTNPGFTDVSAGAYYYGAVAALANNNIISGYGNGTYGVNDTLTRGQMAKIVQGAFQLEGQTEDLPFTDAKGSLYQSYISTLYANNVTKGVNPTTFGVDSPVTRGQLASFVVRAEGTITANPAEVASILANALVDALKPTLNNVGELTIGTPTVKNSDEVITDGTPTVLNFHDSLADEQIGEVLTSIDTTKLKDEVKAKVAPIVLKTPANTVAQIDSIYIDGEKINSENINAKNYIDQITNGLSSDVISSTLQTLTGLEVESALSTTVAQYFQSENAMNHSSIKITFDDQTSFEYVITIQQ